MPFLRRTFGIRAAITLILPLLGAGAAQAQLDFGSPEISGDEIETYAIPVYKLLAAPLGAGRLLPDRSGPAWEIGVETSATPIPDQEPFEDADRSVWPTLRLSGGGRWGGTAAGLRAMTWRDPRMGRILTGGINLSHALPLKPLWDRLNGEVFAQVGWDHLYFGSSYDIRTPGSILTSGETVPGDYTLHEDAWGITAGLSSGPILQSRWSVHARSGPEITFARLRYLYYPPGEPRQDARSSTRLTGWRTEAGVGWRGFRLEAGYCFAPYLNAGWAWGFR